MGESKRLLYVDDIPTPYRLGVHRLLAERWPGGYKLLFMGGAEPGRDWDLNFAGLDVEVLPGRQYRPKGQTNPFSFKWNPGIARSMDAFRPDVVALSGYVHPTIIRAARWCIARGVPYGITCETSSRSTVCSGWRWQVRRTALGWIVRHMAFGLPVGREAADYLRRFGPSSAPMHLFPNTPNTSTIVAEARRIRTQGSEAELRAQFSVKGEVPIILFAGRLIDAKRPMDTLAAFDRISEAGMAATLVIVGDGPLMPAMRARARSRDVVFTGWMRDPMQLAGLMAISRLLVLPSEHEPWGAVVNEALAAGTPVIASDRVTSAVELVEAGVSGYVFPVGDVEALSSRIRDILLLDAQEHARMSVAAQTTATRFGHEFAADNLIEGARLAIRRQRGGFH